MAAVADPPWLKALHARSVALNGALIKPPKPKVAPAPTLVSEHGQWTPTGGGGGTVAPPAAAPPSVTGPPATISTPGYDPNYAALIAGDPSYGQSVSDSTAYDNRLADARTQAIRRAVIQAGFTGGGIQAGGDINQATLDAAAANPDSVAKQLETLKTRGNTDLEANLAARGILSSGAETGGLQRVQDNYSHQQNTAIQQLLDAISGYTNDYADKHYSLLQQQQAAREAAAGRVQSDPRYQPIGAGQATLDPGSGLYVTSDGRWYDSNGNRVSGPPPPLATGQTLQDQIAASKAANPNASKGGYEGPAQDWGPSY